MTLDLRQIAWLDHQIVRDAMSYELDIDITDEEGWYELRAARAIGNWLYMHRPLCSCDVYDPGDPETGPYLVIRDADPNCAYHAWEFDSEQERREAEEAWEERTRVANI